MEPSTQQEREIRAARNQAMFRAVNEQITALNKALESVTDTFTVACECADTTCVEMIDIAPKDYTAVRGEPRCFVCIRGTSTRTWSWWFAKPLRTWSWRRSRPPRRWPRRSHRRPRPVYRAGGGVAEGSGRRPIRRRRAATDRASRTP